jgi:uncharacterized integral membrane protein
VNTGSGHASGFGSALRLVGRFLLILVALVLVVAAWIFTLENRETLTVRFTHWIVHLPVSLALFAAFFLGAFLTLLVTVPRWWSWRLRYHLLHRRHRKLLERGGSDDKEGADS